MLDDEGEEGGEEEEEEAEEEGGWLMAYICKLVQLVVAVSKAVTCEETTAAAAPTSLLSGCNTHIVSMVSRKRSPGWSCCLKWLVHCIPA